MPGLFEIFDANAMAAYWTDIDLHMQDPYILSEWFPENKQTGLTLAWIKGKNQLPVALQPSAFDTKATLRDRVGVSEMSTEMPFFREAARIGEKERQDIELLLARGIKFAEPTIQRVYDDIGRLVEGARVQPERMRASLLTTGKILVSATEATGRTAQYEYDFDSSGEWASENNAELLTTDRWLAANADTAKPVDDLWEGSEALRLVSGTIATTALMNTATLRGMLASNQMRKAMNPIGWQNVITSRAEMVRFLEVETGLTIRLYDKQFVDEQGTTNKFIPDGYVVLLPASSVGETWYGTTPEEFDLMTGATEASVALMGTGIAVTTIKEAHPVNVKTIVSEIVLPSFELMDRVYVLKVF